MGCYLVAVKRRQSIVNGRSSASARTQKIHATCQPTIFVLPKVGPTVKQNELSTCDCLPTMKIRVFSHTLPVSLPSKHR